MKKQEKELFEDYQRAELTKCPCCDEVISSADLKSVRDSWATLECEDQYHEECPECGATVEDEDLVLLSFEEYKNEWL